MDKKTPQNSLSFEDLLDGVDSSPKADEPFPLATHCVIPFFCLFTART